ncbi:MAG: hypothetical protein GWP41_05220 [Planctomycetia bacterium]|jgi:hypothetical protein|nr:hypothetical protein [Planctomycetia bacterium]NCF97998.1 hypothetical protein [Planctomycetia bacterium]NCG12415.1 hypothetical protein [Planctomycetia bacterium]
MIHSPNVGRSLKSAVCLLTLSVLMLFTANNELCAQGEGRGPNGEDMRLLEFIRIDVSKDDKGRYELDIQGKALKMPGGTKVDLLLTWRSQLIETLTITLPVNRKFRETFKLKALEPSSHKYMFRSVVDPKKQTSKVRKELEKNDEWFPPAAAPWTEFHFDNEFVIGTAEEIAAAKKLIQDYFVTTYSELAKLDGVVRKGIADCTEGLEYRLSSGDFDEKEWRKFMDKKVISVLVDYQEEIIKGFNDPKFVAYRLALSHLRDLSVAVSKRTTHESAKLYRAEGLSPSKSDLKPEKLDVKVKSGNRVPRNSDLNNLVEKINQIIGYGIEE